MLEAPEPIIRQRELLQRFRSAYRTRVKAEGEITAFCRSQEQAADATLSEAKTAAQQRCDQLVSQAEGRLKTVESTARTGRDKGVQAAQDGRAKIQAAVASARNALTRAGLDHLLTRAEPKPPALISVGTAQSQLRESVAEATASSTAIVRGVTSLEAQRKAAADRFGMLVILAGVILVLVVWLSITGVRNLQENRANARSTAAAMEATATAAPRATQAAIAKVTAIAEATTISARLATQAAQASETAVIIATATAGQLATQAAQATATADKAAMRAKATTAAQAMVEMPDELHPMYERFGLLFVRVPAGQFTMGSDSGHSEDQSHSVNLDEYWIGLTEVTNAQYRSFIDNRGYLDQSLWTAFGWRWHRDNSITQPGCWDDLESSSSDQPVVCVSWYEAVAYAAWLSRETGLEVRLPSEAEWEKAARGTTSRTYPWGEDRPDSTRANFDDDVGKPSPVGSYPAGAGPYGALDMAGNVWEWTSSRYADYPYAADDGRDDLGSTDGRVARGASWSYPGSYLRSAFRAWFDPSFRSRYIGLRLVVALQ